MRRIVFDDNSDPMTVLPGETIVSSRNVDIAYTVGGTASGILTADTLTINAGDSTGSIPISLSGKTVSANQTLILNFTLTNAAFAYGSLGTNVAKDNNIPTDPANTETLTITFVDKPIVSISTSSTEISSTDYSEWGVSINPAQSEQITVGVTEGGTAGRDGTAITQVVFPANTTFVRQEQTFSSTGTYTVALNNSHADASKYVFDFDSKDLSVEVVDGTSLPAMSLDDAPTVTSTSDSFTITVRNTDTVAQADVIRVNYRVTDSGTNKGFLVSSPISNTIDIPTSKSDDITVSIHRGGTVDGDGQITVELLPGAGYKLGTNASRNVAIPRHGAAVLPEITLTGVPDSVTQGHTFSFTIETSATLVGELPVTVEFNEGTATIISDISPGTYVDGSNSMVTIPQGGSQVVTVSTANDPNVQNQDITITLTGDDSTYTIASGTGGTDTVVSKDNTSPTAANPRISFETFSTKPLSVATNSTITFKILSTPVPATGKQVMVLVGSTGANFLSGSTGLLPPQTLSGAETNLVIDVRNPSGATDETGTVTVELVDGTGYTLANSPNHKTVANLNDNLPVVAITNLTGSVTQGHSYSFNVETSAVVTTPLQVRIQLYNSNEFITSVTPSSAFPEAGEGTVTIPTSGSVKVTVNTQNPTTGFNPNGNQTEGIDIFPRANSYNVEGGSFLRSYQVEYKDNTVSTATQPRLSIANITDPVQADQSSSADLQLLGLRPRRGPIRSLIM